MKKTTLPRFEKFLHENQLRCKRKENIWQVRTIQGDNFVAWLWESQAKYEFSKENEDRILNLLLQVLFR